MAEKLLVFPGKRKHGPVVDELVRSIEEHIDNIRETMAALVGFVAAPQDRPGELDLEDLEYLEEEMVSLYLRMESRVWSPGQVGA